LVVSGLFAVLRWLETWLHQHIFKVGWLVTKDFQTTTILYYTFLLPGVILHEVIYWLAAGLLNVRADASLQYPEAQQTGQLQLNFVKLDKKVPPLRLTFITLAPLAAGVLCVYLIALNLFDIPTVLDIIAPATIPAITAGLGELLRTTDFWLWFYVAFTIANTMIPNPRDLLGIRYVLPALAITIIVLVIIGVGNEVVVGFLSGPVANVLNVLSTTFAVIIAINLFVVGILSIIENTIELITGDSADFRNGKMVTMTREQRLSRRQRRLDRERKDRQRQLRQVYSDEGPPSIYNLPLPIPGGPNVFEVTPLQSIVMDEKPEKPALPAERESRAGASLITAPSDNAEDTDTPPTPPKPQLPATNDEQ